MASHTYTVLPEQAQEDALHAIRLLQVEERPFQRVARSLLSKDSLLKWSPPSQLPSPPPDADDSEPRDADDSAKRDKFREDILLDFAALESSILRIQLIQSSNARERQRYAVEKAKIMETAQAVKDNTLELRVQLAEAQRMLQLRKGYDELAAKLIDPKKLKPRAETTEDISKLEKEIEELQQESVDYEGTWVGRREAFDRVAAEGHAMMKVVKGIKDEPEPEKDEHMEEGEEGDAVAKGERSRIGTPAPELGGRTPLAGGDTPLPDTGEGTPRPNNKMLDIDEEPRSSSLAGSPMLQPQEGDVDMVEDEDKQQGPTSEQAVLSEQDIHEHAETAPDQAETPADGLEGTEDGVEEALGAAFIEEEIATPAEEMDES